MSKTQIPDVLLNKINIVFDWKNIKEIKINEE